MMESLLTALLHSPEHFEDLYKKNQTNSLIDKTDKQSN